jgi:hypothetical protein
MLGYRAFIKAEGEHMDSRRDQVVAQLRGIVSGTTEGTINGGQYTFDPDQIRQVIKNWTELAYSYAKSRQDARPMTTVAPPGNEFVSESFAAKANWSGESYVAYCKRNTLICLQEAQRYQDALDAYLGAEERTIIELGKTDDGGTPPVV